VTTKYADPVCTNFWRCARKSYRHAKVLPHPSSGFYYAYMDWRCAGCKRRVVSSEDKRILLKQKTNLHVRTCEYEEIEGCP
jgi:hypothetical protein